jgi:hypothetical protein
VATYPSPGPLNVRERWCRVYNVWRWPDSCMHPECQTTGKVLAMTEPRDVPDAPEDDQPEPSNDVVEEPAEDDPTTSPEAPTEGDQ